MGKTSGKKRRHSDDGAEKSRRSKKRRGEADMMARLKELEKEIKLLKSRSQDSRTDYSSATSESGRSARSWACSESTSLSRKNCSGGFSPPTQKCSGGFSPPNESDREDSLPPHRGDKKPLSPDVMILDHEDMEKEIDTYLGEDPEKGKVETPNFHESLVNRWSNILEKGLSKEDREALLSKYPLPSNFPKLAVPGLNQEIIQVLGPQSIRKDKFQSDLQVQLGAALTSLGTVLNKIITNKDVGSKMFFPEVCDAGKLLLDLFYNLSKQRRSFVLPQLSSSAMTVARACPVDTFLFGPDFGAKWEQAKRLEQSTKHMAAGKSSYNATKARKEVKSSSLNWKGPSREKRDSRYQGPSRQNSDWTHKSQQRYKRPAKK